MEGTTLLRFGVLIAMPMTVCHHLGPLTPGRQGSRQNAVLFVVTPFQALFAAEVKQNATFGSVTPSPPPLFRGAGYYGDTAFRWFDSVVRQFCTSG